MGKLCIQCLAQFKDVAPNASELPGKWSSVNANCERHSVVKFEEVLLQAKGGKRYLLRMIPGSFEALYNYPRKHQSRPLVIQYQDMPNQAAVGSYFAQAKCG